MEIIEVEWDNEKLEINLRKHGLDFASAKDVLAGFCLDRIDTRKDYGEERVIALGALENTIVVIVYTVRHHRYRIISMRKANHEERKIYQQATSERSN